MARSFRSHSVSVRAGLRLALVLAGISASGALAGPNGLPIDCVVEPSDVVELGSPVDGILESIVVERSDRVREGQVLARLESRVEYAQVALARARARMTAEIGARKATLAFDRRLRARAHALFAKNAISLHDKDQTETDAAVAARQLEQAKEAQHLARLELWRATEALSQRTLRSPISGVVIERYVSPGERIEEEPILKLAQIDPLRIEAIVPASLYGSIRAGMAAEVVPEPPARGTYLATVSVVDRIIDASSGTFRVRAELPNPGYEIPAGLRCKVVFRDSVPASPAP